MFAPIELAARIDRAEARLAAALGMSVLSTKGQSDAFVEEIGSRS
jgi:hypothetical protein